jgi:hypothetical protein
VPIHVEHLSSKVSVGGTELPLTDEQLRKLVELVAAKLRSGRRTGTGDTELRRGAGPTTGLDH